jgi:hypothetical protein
MRICCWGIVEAMQFERTRKKPECRLHDHEDQLRAEALVASGQFRWVGEKKRAITPTLQATDAGYDRAVGIDHRYSFMPCYSGPVKVLQMKAVALKCFPRKPKWNPAPNKTTSPRLHEDQCGIANVNSGERL